MSETGAKRQRACNTEKDLTGLAHGSKRICLPIARAEYERIVLDPQAGRQFLDPLIRHYAELFPAALAQGHQLHDILPVPKKLPAIRLRRLRVVAPEQPAEAVFGHLTTAEYAVRAEALLANFLPYCPRAAVAKQYRSPAHKLNGFVYHDNWLHNLLISASLGGCPQ